METPEDIAAERYFTPPVLRTMLRKTLPIQPWSLYEAHKAEHILAMAKATFKDWLRTVGLPETMNAEETRRLLITLVDEP